MEHIDKSRFAHVGESAHDREAIARPSLTFTQDAIRRLAKNRVALVSVILIIWIPALLDITASDIPGLLVSAVKVSVIVFSVFLVVNALLSIRVIKEEIQRKKLP